MVGFAFRSKQKCQLNTFKFYCSLFRKPNSLSELFFFFFFFLFEAPGIEIKLHLLCGQVIFVMETN